MRRPAAIDVMAGPQDGHIAQHAPELFRGLLLASKRHRIISGAVHK